MNKRVIVKSGKSVFFTDADINQLDQKKLISFVMAQLGRSRSRKKVAMCRKNLARVRKLRWVKSKKS